MRLRGLRLPAKPKRATSGMLRRYPQPSWPKTMTCDGGHIATRLPRLGLQHRTEEEPMLTTTFRQTREIIGEWRRRTRSRHELAMLGELGQRDLACRFDVKSEIHKPFWRA